METTVSLKQNHQFRRLYSKGKSAVSPCLAVYCRKNRLDHDRLVLTVGTKVGKAWLRNRTRRRIREAFRLHEAEIRLGYDIVIVARVKAGFSRYPVLERELLKDLDRLGLLIREKDG